MISEIGTADVVVRDGSTVCVRRTTRDDLDALSEFFHSLSSESLYYRFLGLPALTEARLRQLAATDDGGAGVSLVVESAGRIVAFAGFYRDPHCAERAEVAFAVSDALQGHGIGTRLLEHLARIARDHDISTFEAYVLPQNQRMLEVFRDSGFDVTTRARDGVVHLLISLAATQRFE
jgi:GNAT superfamily N-acetyltransferase